MNYIDELAAAIKVRIDPAILPKGDTTVLFRIYAVLALAKGVAVTAEDVHNAWSAWIIGHKPHHPSVKPFEQLASHTQGEDHPFVEAIHAEVLARDIQPTHSAVDCAS